MDVTKERRKLPRYRIGINAEIHTPAFYISGKIIDISVEGIRVETFIALEPETEVALFLTSAKILFSKGSLLG